MRHVEKERNGRASGDMCRANHQLVLVGFCIWGDAHNNSGSRALIAPIFQREKLTCRDIQRHP